MLLAIIDKGYFISFEGLVSQETITHSGSKYQSNIIIVFRRTYKNIKTVLFNTKLMKENTLMSHIHAYV